MSSIGIDLTPSSKHSDRINEIQLPNDTASLQSQLMVTPTKSKRFSKELYGSPRFSATPSINSYTQKTKRFDERLRSRFSDLLNKDVLSENPHSLSLNSPTKLKNKVNHQGDISSLKWIKLDALNSVLYSGQSRAIHGEPTCIVPGDIVVIGTSKGYILVFDYRQTLIHVLGKNTKALVSGSITSIAMSLDSTHIAAGFEKGDVFVWNLNNVTKPLAHIEPIEGPGSVTDGHVKGSAVNNITFVGRRHTVLVSSDIHGLVFYHRCVRGILGFSVTTERVLGKYDDILLHNSAKTSFACAGLPLGSSIEHTDSLGLVAILSTHALIIISTTNFIRTQFKTGRPKVIDDSLGRSGCLAWFPAVVLKDGTRVPAKLAYCFSNILTVLEVSSVGENLQFDSRKRWACDESILGVQWVNQSQIGVLTATQQLMFINEKNMKVGTTIDLLSKHIFRPNLYLHHHDEFKFVTNYSSSFRTYKGKLFFVGKYEIYIGSSPNWVNILLELVNKGRYIYAIEKATQYYLDDVENLELIGLPSSDIERKPIVLKYLADIIKASATHVLNPKFIETEGEDAVKEYLYTSIKSLISIKAETVVLEELYEVFQGQQKSNLFFEALEPFILSGDLKYLTPVILKDMVAYYISIDNTDTLEKNICLLDIQSLDIDFTISLLRRNKLRDSYIYIWNNLLHDYITPFLEFIDDIKAGEEAAQKVFGYLAYILTGRQYPTEDMIPPKEAEQAKLSLYFTLFNGLPVTFENGKLLVDESTENVMTFSYIYILIMFDSKSFLSAMNEILEDSLLNDDEIIQLENKLKVNRQFLIEVLVEVFTANDFPDLDRLNFAIFIARSYPKFQQFIRLPETLLDDSIQRLCSYEEIDEVKEDCELSLQSLLSVYQPQNKAELVKVFERAKFYEVLINLYLNDKKYSKVLETWIKLDKEHSVETTDSVLERCYKSTNKGSKERTLLDEVVKNYFTELIEVDTYKIVKILNHYCPTAHAYALELKDEQLKYLYLSSLVQLESNGLYILKNCERDAYINVLSTFDEITLLSYVKTLKPSDFELKKCISSLRENGCIETLVYLLNTEGKVQESLDEIISFMEILINKLPRAVLKFDTNNVIHLESEIWRYLKFSTKLANKEITSSQGSTSEDLSLNEKMWLKIINFTVHKLKEFDNGTTSSKVLDIIKRLLQDLFSTLVNTRSRITSFTIDKDGINRHRSSFLNIFTEFLSSSSVTITLLGDVRAVTKEIYLAFSYEKNILTITSRLVDEGIYRNIQSLSEQDHAGWSIKNFECDACGKIIWGRGLNSEAYTHWENKRLHKEEYDESTRFDLVTFSCRHCYHMSCLEKLGNVKGKYECIICQADN